MPTANDEAWERFFARTAVLAEIKDRGFAQVSADDLKLHGQREPRLMAKLDTLSERPTPFRQNHLNILPVQNGLYVIYTDPDNRLYFQFRSSLEDLPLEQYNSRVDLESFDSFRAAGALPSESQVIDFAFLASLLHHFCACQELHLTIRGRLYSGRFSFELPCAERVEVANVQIEVDSGYENADSLVLVEAKIGRRSDFNIRQLVYPYMQWSQKSRKRIRPILLTYSNGEYMLTEFAVGSKFGDIRIISNRAFVVNDNPRAVIDLQAILAGLPAVAEPSGIPFPQADDLNKVVDLIEFLEWGSADKTAIAEFFEFDERQSDYYANAAAYLGLALRNKHTGGFTLTWAGRDFLSLPARTRRTRALLDRMLQIPSLRDCIELLAEKQFDLEMVSPAAVQEIIAARTGMSLQADTLPRRARTIRMWLGWLLKNVCFS